MVYVLVEREGRAILDARPCTGVLAIIKAPDWRAARHQAIRLNVMDVYFYRPGHGWFKKERK